MPTPPLIPQELLFGGRETTAATISPDGSRLAFLAPVGEVANLFVRNLPDGDPRQLTSDTGRGIHTYRWAADGRHLLVEHDTGGDENWQILLVDAETGAARDLVAVPGARAQVLGVDPALPTTVCVTLNRDDPQWADLYHADLASGSLVKVAANQGFSRWALGPDLLPAAAVRPLPQGGAEVLLREGEGWRTGLTLSAEDSFHATFEIFPMWGSADGRRLYLVTTHERDTAELVCLDRATGRLATVAGSARGEANWLHLFDPATREPQLVGIAEERTRYAVVDPAYAADLAALDALSDGDAAILSRDRTDRWWTVEFTRDQGSRHYFLYDRTDRSGRLLFRAQPELDELPLAAMEPVTVPARDGLELPAYLTFPPGRGRDNLPTVVFVHGGPANRWYWGFHPLAQLLANRGFLVVQVNFRGSLGYGKRFFRAGDRQWARAMHHDIIDTVEWVAAQGFADRSRIGLWGTSYGGYECLVAVTHDPDLVACAVPVVAPVNLVSLMRSIPPYWQAEREYFQRVLGEDEDELWERSPLRLAERVKVPLLLFYGEKDPRVPVTEAQQLAEAFDRHGIGYELHVVPDEGHSLGASMSPEHRADYVGRIEAFFARHLAAS